MRPLSPSDYAKARRQRLADEGWLPARFRGRCETCGNRFAEGDMIAPTINHRWRATCCSDDPDERNTDG